MFDPTDFDPSSVDPEAQLLDIDRADCEESLYEFLKAGWKYIDPAVWKDGWAVDAICEHLQAVVDGQIRKLIINCPPRIGKLLADDTPVMTADGWKMHGDLQVGDRVFHPSGRQVEVLAVSGKAPANVRVEFYDGSVFYCHENHEWALYNKTSHKIEILETAHFLQPRLGRWGRTAGRIKQVLVNDGGKTRAMHSLPHVWPLQFEAKELPLSPYVLGAWLGDGSTGKPCITHAAADDAVVKKIALEYPISTRNVHGTTGVVTTYFSMTPLTERLRNIGVFDAKHIPDGYLRASIAQRLELLAGLMDTDGSVDKHSRCHFSNTNEKLIAGVIDLVQSFGWRTCVTQHDPTLSSSGIQGTKPCFVVSFQPDLDIPTQLPRKKIMRFADRRRIGLKSVTLDPIGKIGHCIQVNSPDGLYLAGKNLTPTHNSDCVSVAFPAWVWAQPHNSPTSGPGVPMLYASYADKLSLRDSVKCRRLIETPWYQKRWGHRFQLTSDQNTKSRFANDKGGERLITSIGAGVTGEGGNIICIDDPNAANDVASDASMDEVIEWWQTTMPSRLNDLQTGAWIIIQQRLAENDLTGHILEHEAEGWCHLCLPGRYEPERSYHTVIGWKDPRTQPGELLWPERFSEEALKSLERTMGPYVFAGQIQQRPEPKGGGIIKRDRWKLWEADAYPPMDFILACLDTAYTEDKMNDPSGMIVWGIFSGDVKAATTQILGPRGEILRPSTTFSEFAPLVMCMYAWDDHLELHQLVERVAQTCVKMKVNTLMIENKASGISVAQEIRRLYSRERFAVELFDPKSQDKAARLYSVAHLFAEGIVYGPDRPWMEKVITQVGQFPKGRHDEYVDLTSMGLRKLRDMGLLVRQPEREAEIEAEKVYRGREEPLYAV